MAATCGCEPQAALAQDAGPIAAPEYKPGDTWVYDRTHESKGKSFRQERVDQVIERVGEDTVVLGVKLDGAPGDFEDHMVGLDLSEPKIFDGRTVITERLVSFPLKIGGTWEEDYVDPRQQGIQSSAHVRRIYKVVGWEDVTVPAGTFHALKVEANGTLVAQVYLPASAVSGAVAAPTGGTIVAHTEKARSGTATETTYRVIYYVPGIKRCVKFVDEKYNAEGVRVDRDTSVLASFKAAGEISSASTGETQH